MSSPEMWGYRACTPVRPHTHTPTHARLIVSVCAVADPAVAFALYVNNGGRIILKGPAHAFSPPFHLCEREALKEALRYLM